MQPAGYVGISFYLKSHIRSNRIIMVYKTMFDYLVHLVYQNTTKYIPDNAYI